MAQDFSLRYMLVNGNGNFGSVDYRTATYNSDGSLSTASQNAQVSSSSISLFYDVNTNAQTFSIEVEYANNTYTITCESSVATTLTVFIYDNTTTVVVNNVSYYATDIINIPAAT